MRREPGLRRSASGLRRVMRVTARMRRAAGVLPWLLLCGSAPLAAHAQSGPTLELGGMTFVASRDAVNELVVQATRMSVPPPGDVADLEAVRMVMRNPDGGRALEMTCARSELQLDSADFIARGDVRGVTADGRRFYTDWLHYNNSSGVVSSDAPVRVVDGTHTLSGRGFLYHVSEDRFVLKGGARIVQE